MDVIHRAVQLCEKLIVAVLDNPHKVPLFTVTQRVQLLQEALQDMKNIEIASFSGLLAQFAQQQAVHAIIRGVRDSEDCLNEARYAWHNRLFGTHLETLLLPASPAYAHISSRIVREAAAHIYSTNADDTALHQLVTDNVRTALSNQYKNLEV
jgi:pantetheine-phosphate adenylyltransferase